MQGGQRGTVGVTIESQKEAWKRIHDLTLGNHELTREEYFTCRQHRVLFHNAEKIATTQCIKGTKKELGDQKYREKKQLETEIELSVLGIPTPQEQQKYIQCFGHSLTRVQEQRLLTKTSTPSIHWLANSQQNQMMMNAILTLERETFGTVVRTSFVVHPDHPMLASICFGFLILHDVGSDTDIPDHFKPKDYGDAFYPLYFVFQPDETDAISLDQIKALKESAQHRVPVQYLLMITQRERCCMVICRPKHCRYILVEADSGYIKKMKTIVLNWAHDHLDWKWFPKGSGSSSTENPLKKPTKFVSKFFEKEAKTPVTKELVQEWLRLEKWQEPLDFLTLGKTKIQQLDPGSRTAKAFEYPIKETEKNIKLEKKCHTLLSQIFFYDVDLSKTQDDGKREKKER